MPNYFRTPDSLVDAVRAVLSGQPVEEKLSPKQKELDVDKDGDIEADDLAALRNRKKSEKKVDEGVKKEMHDDEMDDDDEEENGKKKMNGKKDDVDTKPSMDNKATTSESEKSIYPTYNQMKKRDEIYKSMKNQRPEFKRRYGDNWRHAMLAVALQKARGTKEEVDLGEMSDAQMKKREEIVKSMKDKMPDFKKRYGDRAKDVMYATATKMAMKEGFELREEDLNEIV